MHRRDNRVTGSGPGPPPLGVRLHRGRAISPRRGEAIPPRPVQHSVDGGLAVLLALRRWAPMVPGLLVVVISLLVLLHELDHPRQATAATTGGARRPQRRQRP